MAKRELIEREKLINELAESSKHHAQTSREESLLYRDRQIVREQPTITEQEIVKPYLEKLKAEISKSKTEHEMQIAARDTKAKLLISHIYCDIVNILDKCKAESEGNNDREPEKAN